MQKSVGGIEKFFVLDTNVLMHDPSALYRFGEHRIYLSQTVLEELDRNKKGNSEIAYSARKASRIIEDIVGNASVDQMKSGIPILFSGNDTKEGRLYLEVPNLSFTSPKSGTEGLIPDNQILFATKVLVEKEKPCAVILVSKDINMRIKAKALGLETEDYKNDQAIEDVKYLYSGQFLLPQDFLSDHAKELSTPRHHEQQSYTFNDVKEASDWQHNLLLHSDAAEKGFEAIVRTIEGNRVRIETCKNYRKPQNALMGVIARNREQNFALNLLMDPNIHCVTLLGQAGTGKTLLALASGLEQVLEKSDYSEIIFTRATVPIGEDIGFLPGTEEDKMRPWMGAIEDNMDVIKEALAEKAGSVEQKILQMNLREKIKVKSMSFTRGRTFNKKFFIIDEAQNLTPKQMKTLLTRAGPGTKVVCLGNLDQIDTPYLTATSSGLTLLVKRFGNQEKLPHFGHVILKRGERSWLSEMANQFL